MLLGKILVTRGRISEQELQHLLLLKAAGGHLRHVHLRSGEFRFVERETLDSGMIPIALDVAMVVLQGMERLDESNRIRDCVPSQLCVPVVVGDLRRVPTSRPASAASSSWSTTTGRSRTSASRPTPRASSSAASSPPRSRRRAQWCGREWRCASRFRDRLDRRRDADRDRRRARSRRRLPRRAAPPARGAQPRPRRKDTQKSILEAEERMKRVMREEGLSLKAVPQITVSHEIKPSASRPRRASSCHASTAATTSNPSSRSARCRRSKRSSCSASCSTPATSSCYRPTIERAAAAAGPLERAPRTLWPRPGTRPRRGRCSARRSTRCSRRCRRARSRSSRSPDVHLLGDAHRDRQGRAHRARRRARRPALDRRRRRDPHRRLRARRLLDRRRLPRRRQHRGQALDPAAGSQGAAPQLRRRLDPRQRRQPRRRHRALELPPRRQGRSWCRRRRRASRPDGASSARSSATG